MTQVTETITKTFNLLEDLARAGITRVSINRPPPEHASSTLRGVFALEPYPDQIARSFRRTLLWAVMDYHGGKTCGNGLGKTKDGTGYWCQAQARETFFTGDYVWTGEDTNDYRAWYCKEVVDIILNIN